MIILRRYLDKSIDSREISNMILFSLGKLISLFGTYIYTFAIGLYVLKLTGSSLSFATTLAFSIIPTVIVNPIAGVLADKLNRKSLVVSMDILNGMLFLGLYFFSSSYGLSLTMIYFTTFIMTSFMTVFDVSMEASKPNIVSDDKLMKINSISTIIYSMSRILGPMVGGIVFALLDIELFILFNGISFILSGVSEAFIDFNFNGSEVNDEKEIEKINFVEDMIQGFRYLIQKKEVVELLIIFVFLNFSMGLSISVPLPFIINNLLKLSSKYLGIIQSAFPIGLIIGAFFVEGISKKVPYKKLLIIMNLVIAIGIVFTAIPVLPFRLIKDQMSLLIYYSVTMFVIGVAISFIDVPIISILQRSISDEYRGRVLSLTFSLVKIALPLAFIISGILVKILPIYMLQAIGSSILIISSFIAIQNKGKKYFEVTTRIIEIIKVSTIYFTAECLLLIILRARNLEMFFMIFSFVSLILMVDNILVLKSNNPLDGLSYIRKEPLNPSAKIRTKRKRLIREERIYGGIFDEMNPYYMLSLVVNLIGYVLVMTR